MLFRSRRFGRSSFAAPLLQLRSSPRTQTRRMPPNAQPAEEDKTSEAYLARYASPAVIVPRLAGIQGRDDLDTGMRVAGIFSHHI